MRITVLAGGHGGAKFLRGLKEAAPDADITAIGNTGDDIWVFGLRVCPDLDTVMYDLGGGLDRDRGWGRTDESFRALEELRAYGVQPDWFGLGDRDVATHLVRTQMLSAGYPLSEVTEALCHRWQPGVRLLPMTDDRVETHVVIDDGSGPRAVHFQEWWLRMRAAEPARSFVMVGAEDSRPAPGVIDAIAEADVILLPPSNPVVSIGAILSIDEIRQALLASSAPVVGVSGIVANRPLRGMADACLRAIGMECSAAGVAGHFGARPEGLLDGWLIDDSDASSIEAIRRLGITCTATDTMMDTDAAAASVARAAIALAESTRT